MNHVTRSTCSALRRALIAALAAKTPDVIRKQRYVAPCLWPGKSLHVGCNGDSGTTGTTGTTGTQVKVKVKMIRPEAWIKETLPVARWLGVGLPYDHIFLGKCRVPSGLYPDDDW